MKTERFEDAGLADWSEVGTSQGMLAVTRSGKETRNEFSLRVPSGSVDLPISWLQPSDIEFGLLASRTIGK